MSDSNAPVIKLHELAPKETAGRDTISRFEAQFRGAAFECLSILDGKTVDRVFCDYQDDFVSRRKGSIGPLYYFFQVKTKAKLNHQWSRNEVFGLLKRGSQNPKRFAESFAGKLLLHTVRFKDTCVEVVFLTNVHLDDELTKAAADLENGNTNNDLLSLAAGLFNQAFTSAGPFAEDAIKANLSKLVLSSGKSYLNPGQSDFHALARDVIYRYSEIDLQHGESEQIVNELIALVRTKSFSTLLETLDETSLDESAGVGLSDLLKILSISQGAYDTLSLGGDPSAVKTASILQRKLSSAGAPLSVIEFASHCKVEWDTWLREKRHILTEFDIAFLQNELNLMKNDWVVGVLAFADLRPRIDTCLATLASRGLANTLSRDLLLGGVFSALVRSEAR